MIIFIIIYCFTCRMPPHPTFTGSSHITHCTLLETWETWNVYEQQWFVCGFLTLSSHTRFPKSWIHSWPVFDNGVFVVAVAVLLICFVFMFHSFETWCTLHDMVYRSMYWAASSQCQYSNAMHSCFTILLDKTYLCLYMYIWICIDVCDLCLQCALFSVQCALSAYWPVQTETKKHKQREERKKSARIKSENSQRNGITYETQNEMKRNENNKKKKTNIFQRQQTASQPANQPIV